MTYTFGYDYRTATAAANEALDAWATHGGCLLRYGTVTHGVFVVTDDFADDATVMVPTIAGWSWVDELDGHWREIAAAPRELAR